MAKRANRFLRDSEESVDTLDLQTVNPEARTLPYIVVLAGDSVGRVIKLEPGRGMVAGRTRRCDIYFNCENISREHVRFDMDESGATVLADLESTNGTLVNGKRISSVTLEDGDRICMGNVILRFSLKDDLEYDLQQELYNKATRDPLTNAYNKRFFMDYMKKEFAHHQRHEKPLSVVFFDLDDFKRLNDTYGHLTGDLVLKSLAREISDVLREEDVFARFGGEEFVALFRFTAHDKAMLIAGKLLDVVRKLEFATPIESFKVTATAGVATYDGSNMDTAEELLRCADDHLFRGKAQGKDRVIGFDVSRN
ncbi:GGDEF domain-containing protein [Sulfidibacter corallicola]|uniref:diguanylate cyclase n=1 Tax=Sulfidibacter corallicola TaxID=2818388 RepID=A0A8A4TRT1_SULCO|nr:GGDEF domain-containing protein [Sulfidibacter corallicola]QTD52666.1 GGDEF domain-containing protein [Sulfidibacter corallicola]